MPAIFEKIPARHRVFYLAGLGFTLLMAALIAAYLLWFRAPYKVLFSDLRSADAATIIAELDRKKTRYKLADDGATVLVPAKVADATRLNVMSEQLPLKGTVGFELFNKSDMGLTEFAQQINYRRALQGELARTIMALDEVESARVHLSIGEEQVFKEDRQPSKASVTIIPRKGQTLPEGAIRGVQSLIAAAVPDLATDNVVVLDGRGLVISQASGVAAAHAATGGSWVEDRYAAEIRNALAPFYPGRQLEVSVEAGPGAETTLPSQYLTPGDAISAFPIPDRRFALIVRVALDTDLSPAARSGLQQLAIAAAGLSPERGDVLEISRIGATAVVASEPQVAAAPVVTAKTKAPSKFGVGVSLGLAALLIVLAAVMLFVRRRPPGERPLSLEEKRRYAERLQIMLSQETVHAQI